MGSARSIPCSRELSFFQRLRIGCAELPRGAKGVSLGPSMGCGSVAMLRQAFAERLKEAMKARDARTISTVRLIIAGLKDRDIAARTQGNSEGLTETEVRRMLQAMVKQRRESIALYEQGNRADLAQKEREEIAVIESFLPRQLDAGKIEAAARTAIAETGATGIKVRDEVGRVKRTPTAGGTASGRGAAAGGARQRRAVCSSIRRCTRR